MGETLGLANPTYARNARYTPRVALQTQDEHTSLAGQAEPVRRAVPSRRTRARHGLRPAGLSLPPPRGLHPRRRSGTLCPVAI